MKTKSLKRNTIWYLIYILANLAFPLFTGIYVAHVMSPDTIGEITYASNIVVYFAIFSFLGIPTYGLREIAKVRDDRDKVNKIFSELYIINFISTIIFVGAFVGLVFIVDRFRDNLALYLLSGIAIALNAINIDWLYEGVEDFTIRSIGNLFFKVISVVFLFLFVKNDNHNIIYVLISVLGGYGNYLFNFIMHRKYASFTFKGLTFKRHFKPIFYLVSVNLAIEIYSLLDITVIGIFCTNEHITYYKYAHSIQKMLLQVVNVITMVIVPRLSYFHKNDDQESFNRLLSKSFKLIMMLAIPMVIGICIVSDFLMVAVYGEVYIASSNLLRILSIMLIISPIGYLLGSRVCLIFDKEKQMLLCVSIGAVTNLIATFSLTPWLGEYGAAIATIFSEFVVMVVYLIVSRKYYKLVPDKMNYLKIGVSSILLTGFCLLMFFVVGITNWWLLLATVGGGILIYFISLLLMRETFVFEQFKHTIGRLKK